MCPSCAKRLLPDLHRLTALNVQVEKAAANGYKGLADVFNEALVVELIAANLKLAECPKCVQLVDPHMFNK